ncbi:MULTISPECIES: gamma-glutamylcyclotransferase family protein [unclassified Bradyrhizobium]|uniref:gamma-glutamylcyclotransferase family protein n=1 Tax=unclassified Bradyrhizobium TaxID=2631580 RepID=UPI0028E71315|nr:MULTISPECIES: gamma-glutamylcyclotransferase family protein [unclassified Bradyrhizobium]
MLYFAYGSNMHAAQIEKRCPSARLLGKARLDDYRLAFTRESVTNWPGCGVADVLPDKGAHVWGALFEIADADIPSLDRLEGYNPKRAKNAYERIEVRVNKEGDPAAQTPAQTYVVCERIEPNPLPHPHYLARIVSGAEWIQAPAEYIAELRKIEVKKG